MLCAVLNGCRKLFWISAHSLHIFDTFVKLTLICRYCSSPFFNTSVDVPAVLTGPSLTVTLTTGTCAIVKNQTKGDDKTDLLEDSLTCVGPELSYEKVCLQCMT